MVLKMTVHWPSIEDYFHGDAAKKDDQQSPANRKRTPTSRKQSRGAQPPKLPSSPMPSPMLSNPQTPKQTPSSQNSQKRQLPPNNQQQQPHQWGPTHSFSYSEEESSDEHPPQNGPHAAVAKSLSTGGSSGGNGTNPQGDPSPQQQRDSSPPEDHSSSHNSHTLRAIEKFWEHAGSLSRKLSFEYLEQACLGVQCQPSPPSAWHTGTFLHPGTSAAPHQHPPVVATSTTSTAALHASAVSRAAAHEVAHAKQVALTNHNNNNNTGSSGPEAPPEPHPPGVPPLRQHDEIEVLPDHRVQVRLPPSNPDPGVSAGSPNTKKQLTKGAGKFPVETLVVNVADHLERSISELTMRSSYAATCESLNKIPDNRRMAYYAVGKNHRTATSSSHASNAGPLIPRGGCNRRCYFTGKLILGGAVFYAGTVQQGLRTLVVFCLPYALGMPDKELCKGAPRTVVSLSGASSTASPRMFPRDPSRSSGKQQQSQQQPLSSRRRTNTSNGNSNNTVANYSIASKQESMRSRFSSSLDGDMSTIEGDLDPNWGLDPNFLLSVLPEASPDLLAQMSRLYPDQFATLPLQVRDPTRWRLYVKFCFFSGLPIAEGEMHYKVLDSIAELVYDGEEIPLSHEVMEAVNGSESAEILTLPNQKAFRYLRKHYAQQCSKLDERVFRRDSWERVAPEV